MWAVSTTCLADAIPLAPLRLAVAMVVAGLFAAIAGVIVGVPVLRLKGDYLAIVTLAFGEIIKNIVNVMYLGLDDAGLHFSLVNQNFQLGDGNLETILIRRTNDKQEKYHSKRSCKKCRIRNEKTRYSK